MPRKFFCVALFVRQLYRSQSYVLVNYILRFQTINPMPMTLQHKHDLGLSVTQQAYAYIKEHAVAAEIVSAVPTRSGLNKVWDAFPRYLKPPPCSAPYSALTSDRPPETPLIFQVVSMPKRPCTKNRPGHSSAMATICQTTLNVGSNVMAPGCINFPCNGTSIRSVKGKPFYCLSFIRSTAVAERL